MRSKLLAGSGLLSRGVLTMIDFVKDVLSAWPYWVPVLTFFVGTFVGWMNQQEENREENRKQLGRLTEQIEIPTKWRCSVVDIPLDGRAVEKPAMSNAGLLIRSFNGHGSGVCISSEGIILTNAHVVGDESVVEVEDCHGSYLGRVIKRCDQRDVALIRISGRASAVAEVAKDLPAVGDDLYVSGAPWSVENKSVLTRGVVSKHASQEGLSYIYTDAGIAPGNSGGPVFNSVGKLVGITVAMQLTPDNEPAHIGLVIPILQALESVMVKASTALDSGLPAQSRKQVCHSR